MNTPVSLFLFLSLVGLATVIPHAHASIGDRYGYTSSSSAVAGARTGAGEFTSASAYENPSQLSLYSPEESDLAGAPKSSHIRFHWSLLYSTPHFEDIHNVVVENGVNSDKTAGNESYANVDTDYPSTFGQSVGFSIQNRNSDRRWGFGAIAYLPLDHLALVDSGESFAPEYTLHRGANQKPEFQFAASGLLAKNFVFGAGLHLGTKLDSNTTLFLNQGTDTASSLRIAASLKTQASPYVGLTFQPTDTASFGLNYRFASSSPETLNVHATARAIGNVSALDFTFPALATMYYDPGSIEFGWKQRYSNTNKLFFELDYQFWSKFESPTLLIQNPQTASCAPNCGVDFSPGLNLAPKTRNILIERIGHAWTIGDSEFLLGYSYRPGIYSSEPTGAGNAIDPDEHRIAAGYGWIFKSFFAFDAPGRIDLHAAYSIYPKKQVVKTAGDENGNTASKKIGDPGYETGGSEIGGGLTLQLYL